MGIRMRILIIQFLLTSCLLYYGSAAGNTNHELVSIGDANLGDAIVRQKRNVPGGESQQDPNDQQYSKVAEARRLAVKQSSNSEIFVGEYVKEYLKTEYAKLHMTVDRTVVKSVRRSKTRLAKQKITHYKIDAFAHVMSGDYSIYNCSVVFGTWYGKKPIATNCIKVNYLIGHSVWVDPTNKKYKSFAEKSLQLYLKNTTDNGGPPDYRKYDIVVTFVRRGLAAGYVNYMDFVAHWVHGYDDDPTVLICSSKVWEKLKGKLDIHSACRPIQWHRGSKNIY